MRIAACIQTFNMHSTGRADMFARTFDSLMAGQPDALNVLTNGSTDGTSDDVRRLGGIVDDANGAMWFGMQKAILWCLKQSPDIVLFSADDIEYRPGWRQRLESFWKAAPENLKLASLYLEPTWSWNEVYDARDIGGERVLLRRSIPGASWTFRARDWRHIGPIPTHSPGEDLDVCRRLQGRGFDLAQLDLAEHLGANSSAWGNESWKYAEPLDRARWGLVA